MNKDGFAPGIVPSLVALCAAAANQVIRLGYNPRSRTDDTKPGDKRCMLP